MPAMAMIGTASRGPKASISAGISMIEAPKPTMPLSVPAPSPSARTTSQVMDAAPGGNRSALALSPLVR